MALGARLRRLFFHSTSSLHCQFVAIISQTAWRRVSGVYCSGSSAARAERNKQSPPPPHSMTSPSTWTMSAMPAAVGASVAPLVPSEPWGACGPRAGRGGSREGVEPRPRPRSVTGFSRGRRSLGCWGPLGCRPPLDCWRPLDCWPLLDCRRPLDCWRPLDRLAERFPVGLT